MNNKVKKVRLDIYLVDNNYFSSREKARLAIMEGNVYVNNQKEDKPGTMIRDDALVEYRGEKLKYVSRGGLKLEKAIKVFNIQLNDKICIDIGSSTGGFTDCMLQNGAQKVYAVDCGTNQLDYKLRNNVRVVTLENTNARYLSKEMFKDDVIDFISADVSFISITKILPKVKEMLCELGKSIILIKPQFEAGKEFVEKGGVVKDKKIHKKIVSDIINFCLENSFLICGLDFSPIKGPAGNIEYLLYIENHKVDIDNSNINISEIIDKVVDESHRVLNQEV